MAGAGYKLFNTGDVLTAAQVNTYLQEQTVMVFADATARTTALSGVLAEGMVTYLKSTKVVEIYNGTAWASLDDPNAIQNTIVDAKGDLITATAADTPSRLAVGNSGETLVADSSATTGLRWQGNFAAGKNKIINGDFGIWQRGAGSFTASGAYTADRYTMAFTGTGTAQTLTREAFNAGAAPVAGYEAQYFCRNVVTGGSGTSSLVVLQQKVEDVRTFAGQTVTVSFWAKANTGTPSIGLDLYQDFGSGGSSTVSNGGTKVAITTSWARYSATISLASISGKTIGTGNFLCLRLWFSSGSDYNSLNNSLGIQSATFDVWGVQLEAGNTATAFQTATGTLAGELAACQRYYWRANANASNTSAKFCNAVPQSSTTGYAAIVNPVPMRVPATSMDFSNISYLNFGLTRYPASNLAIASNSQTTTVSFFQFTATSMTAGQFGWVEGNDSASAYIGFNAEL